MTPRPPAQEPHYDLDLNKVDPRLPAREQAYTLLREAIVSTRIPPGAMISENRICAAMGVSRTPIRDAILRLSDEGLVEVYPQRGSFVAPINLSRVYEGHFVRRALELAVLKEAGQRWTKEDSRKVRAIIARQKEANDPPEVLEVDDEFHAYFCKVAGFQGVWSTIQAAKSHLDRVRHLAVPVPGNRKAVIAEHTKVVTALDKGDVRSAVKFHRKHLDTVYDTIKKLARQHEGIFVDRKAG